MKEIIELLKKEGFVDNLQHCISATAKLSETSEKAQLEASKRLLINFMQKKDDDDELLDKFFEFATDLAAEAIIKELNLKPDENYEPDKMEKLIAKLFEFIRE